MRRNEQGNGGIKGKKFKGEGALKGNICILVERENYYGGDKKNYVQEIY